MALPPVTRILFPLEYSNTRAPLLILNTRCSNVSRLLAVKIEENLVDDILVLEKVRLEVSVLDEPIERRRFNRRFNTETLHDLVANSSLS